MEKPQQNIFKKTIGILGGMGPVATAYAYKELILGAHRLFGAQQDYEFPKIQMLSLPLTGLEPSGITNPKAAAAELVEGALSLQRSGADFIIIPCNTVHVFYEQMRAAVQIPILHIVEECVSEASRAYFTRVGLLSTGTTKSSKLYERALAAKGIQIVTTTGQEQKSVENLILDVMTEDYNMSDLLAVQRTIARMCDAGAQAIILGCTELPVVLRQEDFTVPLLNSTRILTTAALQYAVEKQTALPVSKERDRLMKR